MSVTGNFFCKLRSLAVTLEKETAHLEQVFNQEDSDYEDESPMRVLHDLRTEIVGLKTDIQGTLDKNRKKGDELNSIIKICKVLQTRNASDIHHVKDMFQKYGYKPPDNDTSDNEVFSENVKPDGADEINQDTDPAHLPHTPPPMQKQALMDLRAPQLSDFGLSHYQLPIVWEPQKEKLQVQKVPEEKPKPLYKDIRKLNVAKTPKCSLTKEEDFSQIQHFGISDYSSNLNDDYTIALINKQKASVAAICSKEPSHHLKSVLATPAQMKYRNDVYTVDSPLPPVFCTPGLKVHRKVAEQETCDVNQPESIRGGCGNSSEECISSKAAFSFQALGRDIVDSPQPPTFCTPGLKVQKKEISCVVEKPVEDKEENVAKSLDTPPVPSFETRWLKTDTLARSLDVTEPIPRPEMSHTVYLEQAAELGSNADKYGNPTQTTSPPRMRDFTIGTPPRPEMTTRLTEDVFKYSMKPASPPKISEYEKLLWTPTRPEMTSCISEDISKFLSQYSENNPKTSWQDPQDMNTRNRYTDNKENRP